MSLLSKLRHRVLELMIVNRLPRKEALKLATRQYRAEFEDGAAAAPATTKPDSNIKEQLFARIMGMKARSEAQAATSLPQINAPTTAGRLGNAVRRLFEEPDKPKPEPEPEPVEEMSAEAIVSGVPGRLFAGRAVSLNREFPDPIVDNWRASLDPPARDFGPPIDMTPDNLAKLYALQQARIAKEHPK
jgi:hypothetical protein